MLKEVLILILLLQLSHAENATSLNCDQYENPDWAHWPDPDCMELPKCLNLPSSFGTCKNCGGKIIGHDNLMMICVPTYFKESFIHPPYNRVPMKDGKWNMPLTDIMITMKNIQVIDIGTHSHTITISMNFVARWFDYRLKVWNNPPKDYYTWFVLTAEDYLFWFPKIDISNNMVSKKEQDETFQLLRLKNMSITRVSWRVYLSTTLTCEMNFETFPFDKHVCNLEVCYIVT